MCAIDNLNKGAAGGAVQWMNRMLGFEETTGLTAPAARLDLNMTSHAHQSHSRTGARSLAPVFAQYPIEIVSADGVWLNTRDGRRVLDLYGGHAVAALGYGHPRWLQALQQQARSVVFQTNAVAMEVRERAANRLVRFAGLDLDTVFFVNTGAEANENALKLALRQSGRSKIVAVEQSFHGRTAAAGAVTWGAAEKWYGFPRTPFDVSFMPRRDEAAVARHIDRGDCRGHHRTRAGPRRCLRHGPRVSARIAAPALQRSARSSSSTRFSVAWAAAASRSRPTCTA